MLKFILCDISIILYYISILHKIGSICYNSPQGLEIASDITSSLDTYILYTYVHQKLFCK